MLFYREFLAIAVMCFYLARAVSKLTEFQLAWIIIPQALFQ